MHLGLLARLLLQQLLLQLAALLLLAAPLHVAAQRSRHAP